MPCDSHKMFMRSLLPFFPASVCRRAFGRMRKLKEIECDHAHFDYLELSNISKTIHSLRKPVKSSLTFSKLWGACTESEPQILGVGFPKPLYEQNMTPRGAAWSHRGVARSTPVPQPSHQPAQLIQPLTTFI